MPSLPPDANHTSEPSDEGIDVASRSIPSGRCPILTVPPSSRSGRLADRIKRLEEIIYELKSRLPVVTNSYQSVYSRNEDIRLPASPSTAEKRTYDQIVALDESIDHGMPRSRFRRDDRISMALNSQTFAPRSLYFHPRQRATREAASPKRDQAASQPSMLLKNCASGNCFLPPPDEGSSLLNQYLHDFNSKIPLFHPETIYTHVRDCYSGAADKSPLSWVLAYIALGIGHRMRAMSLFAAPDDTSNAEWYLNKCLSVLPDLLLQEPSLPLVQALLGVSVLLQSSVRSRRAALFVSTATHMAQDLAYNEAAPDQDEGSPRDKQELYVFWVAFFMDTAMSLHAIRPNTQRLADISAPLPSASSSDWWVSSTSDDDTVDCKVNIFALHASLALIQAEALEELFSVKARQHSASLTASTFKSIISKLEIWRRMNALADTDAPSMRNSMYQSDMAHSIILEASYFATLYQLHAANALGAFTRRLDVFSPSELTAAAGLICFDIYADAQHLLTFAALISQGNVSVTW